MSLLMIEPASSAELLSNSFVASVAGKMTKNVYPSVRLLSSRHTKYLRIEHDYDTYHSFIN